MHTLGRYVGTFRTHDSISSYHPPCPATDRQARARRLAQTRDAKVNQRFTDKDTPLDESGNLNTDDEGLCQCGPCKSRRAAASRDEALETEPGKAPATPKEVNAFNDARWGRK